ncbi:hypothetical protein ACNKHM_21035 [Shigella sonnei]
MACRYRGARNAGISKVEQMQATPARGEPDQLAIEARKTGFDDLSAYSVPIRHNGEASRCLKCGEHSVCKWTCPLHNHIPQWIELVKAGNIDAAVELSHQTNTLPEITGRVCPQTVCVKVPVLFAMSTAQ